VVSDDGRLSSDEGQVQRTERMMKYIKLGDLEVSRIGLGAMSMSHACTGAGTDDTEAVRTIHRALDLGVTFIDTAEVHGPFTNETLVGGALQGRRDDIVLATEFGFMSHTGREGGWFPLENAEPSR
jgi:aryl-alcohol dehydrogenase-like predicted oxidoreductase